MSGRIAILLTDLNGGGVQKVMNVLARAFADRGHEVDLLVCRKVGALVDLVDPRLRVVELATVHPLAGRLRAVRADPKGLTHLWRYLLTSPGRGTRTIGALPALADHLAKERPAVLMSTDPFLNVESVLARRLAGTDTRIVMTERTHFSSGKGRKVWRARKLSAAMSYAYRQADAIHAVSHGVADDIARTFDLDRSTIRVIHNPTIGPDFQERAAAPADHPWFTDRPASRAPLVVAVGRPTEQKDFPTLVRAFAMVRARRPVRLAIVGDVGHGKRRRPVDRLEALARELGVADDLAFLGWTANPLPYVGGADLLCLSSMWEGLPNVLLEALACGTPIVSTDCPSGPREILDGGRFGRLVPVCDPEAMAEAINATLDDPPARERLLARAADFDFTTSIDRYLDMLLPGRTEVRPHHEVCGHDRIAAAS
ncbi:MAG: glycosyltransferase [Geminicoccaceae bacterium]|nr:glycosyltransferase [Geminicoccaceae bacterium]